MLVVQRLACILLQMQPLDADAHRIAVGQRDLNLTLAHDRRFVLADLIALRQVRIEIILAIENRLAVDPGLEAKSRADGLADAFLVDDRQHAGHGGIDERNMAVRCAAKFGRSAGEQFGLGADLGVHLHADDHLPVAGGAADQFGRFGLRSHRITAWIYTLPSPARPLASSIAAVRTGSKFPARNAIMP